MTQSFRTITAQTHYFGMYIFFQGIIKILEISVKSLRRNLKKLPEIFTVIFWILTYMSFEKAVDHGILEPIAAFHTNGGRHSEIYISFLSLLHVRT